MRPKTGADVKFEQLLCPVDFSETSAAALRVTGRLGKALDADLTVLHALRWQFPAYFTAAQIEDLEAQLRKSGPAAQRFLEDFASWNLPSGLRRSYRLMEDEPVAAILRAAREMEVDLIVMGTHGRTGCSRFHLGSVMEGVLRQGAMPVLTVGPGTASANQAAVREILCPREFGRPMGNDVGGGHLLGPEDGCAADRAACGERDGEDTLKPAEERLCQWVRLKSKEPCCLRHVVRSGKVIEVIVEEAQRIGCVLVIGARPRSGLTSIYSAARQKRSFELHHAQFWWRRRPRSRSTELRPLRAEEGITAMKASNHCVALIDVVGMATLLSGCGSEPTHPPATAATVTEVSVETVHLQGWPSEYAAVGTVRSATSSVLSAQVSGTVREIRVKSGDRVRRGQVLAVLDDRRARAQLAAAEAGVEESQQGLAEVESDLRAAAAERNLAEVTYHRYENLLARDSVTRQEFDNTEARYRSALAHEASLAAKKREMQAHGQQAQSERESARTMFSYSRIVSPLDGWVTAKFVDPGTLAMPGTPILTVEATAHYRLEASVPEDLMPKIRLGQKAEVRTEHGRFAGSVVEIVPAADPGSRTFVVKVSLPQACSCRSGEYGKAAFPIGEERVLSIPRQALVERGQLEGVYVVDSQHRAEYRLVKIGREQPDRLEVLSGLSEGEQVAASGLDRLTDGIRVVGP